MKKTDVFFGGYCATFDDGFSMVSGGQPGTSYQCYHAPLYEKIQNGLQYGYKMTKDRCGHALLLEKISEYAYVWRHAVRCIDAAR
jgi:hypothetical protein